MTHDGRRDAAAKGRQVGEQLRHGARSGCERSHGKVLQRCQLVLRSLRGDVVLGAGLGIDPEGRRGLEAARQRYQEIRGHVPLGHSEFSSVINKFKNTQPNVIFSTVVGDSVVALHRQYRAAGLDPGKMPMASLTTSENEVAAMGGDAAAGHFTSAPYFMVWDSPENHKFVDAYKKKYNDYPRLGSVVGYVTMKSLAAGIAKAKSTDTEKLVEAFKDLKVDSPFGPFHYRASDHQATMGCYVGKIVLENGKGTMADFKYVDGVSVLPGDAEVKKLRPTETN